MRTFTLLAIVVALAALSEARPQDEAEYYDDVVETAPVPSSTARPTSLNRGRGLSSLRKPAAGKKVAPEPSSTTTTTTAAPAEYEDEEENSQEEAAAPVSEEPTTKKYLIAGRNGVVRPFRSNDELLAALKRRRSQTKVSTHAPPSSGQDEQTEAPKPVKPNKGGNRSNNVNAVPRKHFSPSTRGHVAPQPVAQSVEPVEAPKARHAPPTFARRASLNRSRPQEEQLAAEDAEESQQHQEDAPAPKRTFSPRRRS
ncbi:uncharacterized protein LOC132204258 [Neocloeon triangulifer]|uniref:uncharacterized protein LOC132204258 n=1 Tax=Neocloeon triangulifer TaxID=2078957 RepID=UPI00286EF674|nr:uncharacterized protein LOC132204258 [Neocloeon triangulifer]